jgi:hypothetical protein
MSVLEELILDEELPARVRELAGIRWAMYDGLQRSKTPDPNTGMVAPPPPFVKGVPMMIQQAFMAGMQPSNPEGFDVPANNYGPTAPGAGFQSASPTPEMSPMATQAGALQQMPLGSFGSVEQR